MELWDARLLLNKSKDSNARNFLPRLGEIAPSIMLLDRFKYLKPISFDKASKMFPIRWFEDIPT